MNDHITHDSTITPRGERVADDLAALLGEEATADWSSIPQVYHPEIVLIGRNGEPAAALLVTHRPYTAYRKITRAWWRDDAALDAAVQALLTHSGELDGVAAVKWEDTDAVFAEHASRNGFAPMPAPIPSGAGTHHRAGFVRWLVDLPHRPVPYYRQTTEYSCGPVALLMAESARSGVPITRDQELKLWRRSAHQPGAGPIALGVYADLALHRPEVFISTDEVILGEHLLKPWEQEVRALFDGEDERSAGELGIPIVHRLFTLDELASAVEADAGVLLLIDEVYFHAETGSHWILAHAHRDGVFLVSDPWIDAENGDSWVDASDLPVAAADLEKIVWWGDPAFRALVVLRPEGV
jgi:hypothetical protein